MHQTRTGKTLLVMVLVKFVMEIHYKIEYKLQHE